jgi:predicted HicB family RNase H-like nuclease
MTELETTTVEPTIPHPREPRSKQIGAWVSPRVYRQLERVAGAERRSLSQLGAMAIEEFLERRMPEGDGDGA